MDAIRRAVFWVLLVSGILLNSFACAWAILTGGEPLWLMIIGWFLGVAVTIPLAFLATKLVISNLTRMMSPILLNYPFGAIRACSVPTDRKFTGQILDSIAR